MIIPLNEIAGMPGVPTHPIAPGGQPGRPDQGLPPPGWPGGPHVPSQGPGFPTNPIAPGGQQPGIDNSLPPLPPGTSPPNVPSTGPGFPTHPINLPGTPNAPPGQIWPPVADVHTKTWTLAWLPGHGLRWITVEPPRPDQGLPPGMPGQPARPGQPLPPTAQPKA
jgi:formin 2/diaphanous 1/splicing factor 3A subunit 2